MSNNAREIGYLIAGTLATYTYTQNGFTAGVAVLAVVLGILRALDAILELRHRRRLHRSRTFGELLEDTERALLELQVQIGTELAKPLQQIIDNAKAYQADVTRILNEVRRNAD